MIILAVLTLLFFSSNDSASRNFEAPAAAQSPKEEIAKGVVVEKVVCRADPAQSYALYLPSNYDPSRQWPILYGFDPGARGRLPVTQFKDAAEKYGWIVVG